MTVSGLRARAEEAFQEKAFEDALRDYLAILCVQPEHLDARLRVADSLLALGQVQRAAVVYTTFARYAANEGHPLRALVAIKILSTLEPLLEALISSVAELYAVDGKVGRGARPTPANEEGVIAPAMPELRVLGGEALYEQAEQIGKTLPTIRVPDVLPPIPLLSELSRDDFVTVFRQVALLRKGPRQSVVKQGEVAESFFIAARGDYQVSRTESDGSESHLTTLHEGAVFGEMALLIHAPRTASIVTLRDADLFEIHVQTLSQLSSGDGASTIARALAKFTRERMVHNLIHTAPLFKPLSLSQRIDLVRRFVAYEVAVHTDLIREGEPGKGLYVVLQGAVDVSKRVGDEKLLLATLKAGDVFGEMSLLEGGPAAATVTAAERSTVLFLARDYVERLMESVPELSTYLTSLGDERSLDTRMWLDGASGAEQPTESIDIEVEWVD